MTIFRREFRLDRLNDTVLKENSWFTDLLRRWQPAGEAVNGSLGVAKDLLVRDCVDKGQLQHLRVAFRGRYMNFYFGGQSIAMVKFGHSGLRAEINEKYVYGSKGVWKKCVKLTSRGFPELGTGQSVPYCEKFLKEWINNAKEKIGQEKGFVDLVVAHNPDVIDLEMALPAHSKIPGKRPRAPRVDLVVLEPFRDSWQIAFWEVKLVGDGRARCEGDELPEVVVEQLEPYADWFSDGTRAKNVAKAYQENCKLLVGLHAIARRIRPDIEELGRGIRAVAASDTTPYVDIKPRLLIVYDKDDKSFEENRHINKLRNAGWCVKPVKSLSSLALCVQS